MNRKNRKNYFSSKSIFTLKPCSSIKRLFLLTLVNNANFQISNCPGIAKKIPVLSGRKIYFELQSKYKQGCYFERWGR